MKTGILFKLLMRWGVYCILENLLTAALFIAFNATPDHVSLGSVLVLGCALLASDLTYGRPVLAILPFMAGLHRSRLGSLFIPLISLVLIYTVILLGRPRGYLVYFVGDHFYQRVVFFQLVSCALLTVPFALAIKKLVVPDAATAISAG